MKQPIHYLTHMVLFLAAIAMIGVAFAPRLTGAFMANPWLNGTIAVVFLFGVVFAFRQVLLLKTEIRWVESSRSNGERTETVQPLLLAPMAAMLGDRPRNRVRMSATSFRTLMDGVASRLDEGRDLMRYFIGLLVFLGLLGTFWGLLGAIGAFSDTIGGLTVAGDDMAMVFDDLKQGLERPLGGMATAFSSSLFGLAGSVLLGFLDLQVGQAQNRFYNDLEDWLSSVTELGTGGGASGEDDGSSAYVAALLEQSADSIDQLNRTIARSESGKGEINAALLTLAEKMSDLTDRMQAEQSQMARLGESQREVERLMAKLLDHMTQQQPGLDDASRAHLRSMDVAMKRLIEEEERTRSETTDTLRQEIKLLSRTLAAAIGGMKPRSGADAPSAGTSRAPLRANREDDGTGA